MKIGTNVKMLKLRILVLHNLCTTKTVKPYKDNIKNIIIYINILYYYNL